MPILEQFALLAKRTNLGRRPNQNVLMVKHIMVEDVVAAKPNATIKDVVRTLYEKHVGSIVITDYDHKCVGIFTERDAIRIIANEVPLDTPVDQVMTKNVVTIGEEASLEEARRIVMSHRIRHIPVVDQKGELVGLLSIRKLLEQLFGLDSTKYS